MSNGNPIDKTRKMLYCNIVSGLEQPTMSFKIEYEEQIKQVLGNAEIERKRHIDYLSEAGLTDQEIAFIMTRIGKLYLLTTTGVNNIKNNG